MITEVFSSSKTYGAPAGAGVGVWCVTVDPVDREADGPAQSLCLFGYQAYPSEKRGACELVTSLPRAINCAFSECVTQKQNSTSGLNISRRLHRGELGIAGGKGRIKGLDSISKGAEAGKAAWPEPRWMPRQHVPKCRLCSPTGPPTVVLGDTGTWH